MNQAVEAGLWPESHQGGRAAPASWSIERQEAPVEDHLRFFPGQAGGRVYEQLLFNLPMNLQCLDGAGCISSVNRQWMETLGYTLGEVSGRHWHELLDQDSRHLLTRHVYPRYLQSAVIRHVEIVMRRKDGQPANMLMSAQGYRGSKGRIERSIVMLHEVAAPSRSAETALLQSEERFRGAFDAAAHGIVLVAPNGRVLAHNPAFKDLSGRSDEELSNFAFDESIHADDKASFLSAIRGLILGEVASVKMELRYVGGGQPLAWGLTSVSLVRNERQDIDHLVVQVVDTTSRRQAEKQLQQAQRMEAAGQLAGRLAHDFNNVLTVIMGNLELIELALADTKALTRVKEAIEAAREGSQVTRQLLSFSRPRDLAPSELPVNEILTKLGTLIERILGEAIGLELVLMKHDATILVDPAQFETAIVNLALNARDAMPSGGRFVLETRQVLPDPARAAESPDAEPAGYVVIAATERVGGGQSVVPATAQESAPGTDLAMVNGFAMQSGGRLSVARVEGEGTTVRLYLPCRGPAANASAAGMAAATNAPGLPEAGPLAPAEPGESRPPPFVVAPERAGSPSSLTGAQASDAILPPVTAAPAIAIETKRKPKILVVEDQEGVREVAAGFLEEFGYEVIEAEDGITALSLLQEHKDIDLMFSDVVMPGGLNGFDVAQAAEQIIPDLLILHTSGYPKGAMVHSEEPRLKDNIIMKPYRREELKRAIDEAFARKKLPR